MSSHLTRAVAGLGIAAAAGIGGYTLGSTPATAQSTNATSTPGVTVANPKPGTTRVLYSLDAKQNDQALISLINAAQHHIYFAIYEFTLADVADALVAAHQRGVAVEGLVDATESAKSYEAPIVAKLRAAGIPVIVAHHADGKGIMHIKALVTDSAYAIGSYNWTYSATHENDEILEVGTDPTLRNTYATLLKRLITEYKTGSGTQTAKAGGTYTTSEAPAHIGEYATVTGTLVDAYTSKSGTIFLDFCAQYAQCPFSAVIFSADAAKFSNISRYSGEHIAVTGTITSYKQRAEIDVSDPSQIH